MMLMPTDAPNSLPIRTYLNILSYILEANEFPAGGSDLLDPAALRQIIITAKRLSQIANRTHLQKPPRTTSRIQPKLMHH